MGRQAGKIHESFARSRGMFKQLREPQAAAAYLNSAMMIQDRAFLQGMRDVLQANGGISKVAAQSKLNRQAVYRMLSSDGNPELRSLQRLLASAGLRLRVIPSESA